MIHQFAEIKPAPNVKCKVCGHIVIAHEGVDLTKINPECGEVMPPAPAHGPGTEFAKLTASFGLTIPCGSCKQLLADMNRWGPACEERREKILIRLKANESHLGWGEWLKAGAKAFAAGYRSLGDVLDEAIHRSKLEEC